MGTATCELKLLTASKDVGIRRWRGFAAAFSGSGAIFPTAAELMRNLAAGSGQGEANVVVHDQTIPLSLEQLAQIRTQARLFIVESPLLKAAPKTSVDAAWQAEAYLQCSLSALLEAQVVRMSLTQLVLGTGPMQLTNLLGWGHSTSVCTLPRQDLADVSLAFLRRLSLTGESRRLTEMFTHFLTTRLRSLRLEQDTVTFGSDGLVILVAARCRSLAGFDMATVAAELQTQGLQVSIANQLPGGVLEIAGLFYPQTAASKAAERMLLVFNKTAALAAKAAAPEPDDKPDDATLRRAG